MHRWADTKEHLSQWLIQRAPFNLTDGVWLRNITPTGPITDTEGLLFAIYADELGNGDYKQNHCNVFVDIIRSLGIELPPVRSRAFVDLKCILESSFTKPVYTLASSLWSQTFFPEILGQTLWLEWNSPPEHAPAAKALEKWGLNPTFSILHTAIDNVVNGHGRYALNAIHNYLSEIDAREGHKAMQEHWLRIWTGYTACKLNVIEFRITVPGCVSPACRCAFLLTMYMSVW